MVARRSSVPSRSPTGDTRSHISVPKQTKDPISSLRPWPLTVTVGHREFTVPVATATDWLSVLMAQPFDLMEMLLAVVDDGPDLVTDESLSLDDLYTLCVDVIEQASGRSWWITMRLVGVVRENWNVLFADLLIRGVDPNRVSLSAWLDALLLTAIRNMEPDKVNMFLTQLEMPPKGVQTKPEDMQMSKDAFLALGS